MVQSQTLQAARKSIPQNALSTGHPTDFSLKREGCELKADELVYLLFASVTSLAYINMKS